MFIESFGVQVDIPEPGHGFGYRRIDAVIIGQDAVGLMRKLRKDTGRPIHVPGQLLFRHALQASLRKRRNSFHRMLHAVKIGFQIHPACFTHQIKRPVGIPVTQVLNRNGADKSNDTQ